MQNTPNQTTQTVSSASPNKVAPVALLQNKPRLKFATLGQIEKEIRKETGREDLTTLLNRLRGFDLSPYPVRFFEALHRLNPADDEACPGRLKYEMEELDQFLNTPQRGHELLVAAWLCGAHFKWLEAKLLADLGGEVTPIWVSWGRRRPGKDQIQRFYTECSKAYGLRQAARIRQHKGPHCC